MNPFRWREDPRPSIFATDPLFTIGAAKGRTMSQIGSANIEKRTAETGVSPGTIKGISRKTEIGKPIPTRRRPVV